MKIVHVVAKMVKNVLAMVNAIVMKIVMKTAIADVMEINKALCTFLLKDGVL